MTPFADFIRNATPERKAEVYAVVMRKASERQSKALAESKAKRAIVRGDRQ